MIIVIIIYSLVTLGVMSEVRTVKRDKKKLLNTLKEVKKEHEYNETILETQKGIIELQNELLEDKFKEERKDKEWREIYEN